MHNVKRMSADKRAELRKENEEQAARYNELSRTMMSIRANLQYDQVALDAAARVVRINPDMATAWNFRRQVLEHMHPVQESDAQMSSERKTACEAELMLTQECLGANPKSYPAWFHREWVLVWGRCSYQWATELKLTAKFLSLDDRNFHCWTYRRAVCRLASVTAQAELAFTTTKIEHNFSNYSAWHYRSKLLCEIYCSPAGLAEFGSSGWRSRLLDELQLVRSAFYTAPDDSSAWFYHRWILAQLKELSTAQSIDHIATLQDELRVVEELIEIEPESKWPLAAAVHLGQMLASTDPAIGERTAAWLRTLVEVDPARRNHYSHLIETQIAS